MATDILFSDLDLKFIPHPLSGDIGIKTNDQAIKQSIKIILLTMFYERPFHSEFGSSIRRLLFEPFTPMLNVTLERSIEHTLKNFEPRISTTLIKVTANPDNYSMGISIYYTIINTASLQTFNIILERTR